MPMKISIRAERAKVPTVNIKVVEIFVAKGCLPCIRNSNPRARWSETSTIGRQDPALHHRSIQHLGGLGNTCDRRNLCRIESKHSQRVKVRHARREVVWQRAQVVPGKSPACTKHRITQRTPPTYSSNGRGAGCIWRKYRLPTTGLQLRKAVHQYCAALLGHE